MNPDQTQLLDDRVDQYLAETVSWMIIFESLPTRQLVEMAREMDNGLRSDRYPGPRYRSAIAGKLIEISEELRRRIASAPLGRDGVPQLDGLDWIPGSPNAGLLEDITPFGQGDVWVAIAASVPPEPPSLRRRRRQTRPVPSPGSRPPIGRGPAVGRGSVPGHRRNAQLRGGAQGGVLGREINERNESAGEAADMVSRNGDLLSMVPFPGLAGAWAIVGTIIAYVAAMHAEHQRTRARARLLGARIGAIGLITLANYRSSGPPRSASVNNLHGAATTAGLLPAALNSLRLHSTQVTDAGLDDEIHRVLQHISSSVILRVEVVNNRAREQGLNYLQRDELMREFYLAVGTGILGQLEDI